MKSMSRAQWAKPQIAKWATDGHQEAIFQLNKILSAIQLFEVCASNSSNPVLHGRKTHSPNTSAAGQEQAHCHTGAVQRACVYQSGGPGQDGRVAKQRLHLLCRSLVTMQTETPARGPLSLQPWLPVRAWTRIHP